MENHLSSADAIQIAEAVAKIKENIGRVLVGKDDVIDLTLAAILSGGHLLVEDVPGIGKTTLARALASSLDCEFRRIQFTPDLMPSDITGIHYYNQKSGDFEFRPGPVIAQIVLADEINRATPRTQSAMLEAMAERQLTIDDNDVNGFREKVELPYWINAGIYVFHRGIASQLPELGDHETETFPRLAQAGQISAFRTRSFWRSVDSFKDLREAEEYVVSCAP